MPKLPERFENKIIYCKKCRLAVGEQILDGQVLILESQNFAVFNFLSFQCLICSTNQRWESPLLPGEQPSFDRLLPDSINDLPKPPDIGESASDIAARVRDKKIRSRNSY